MSDQPQEQVEPTADPPEPDPDLDLIGHVERGYDGPRETKSANES